MATTKPKPPWLKVKLPGSPRYHAIRKRARSLGLATVCEEARCPNIGECWGEGTATFMLMGDTCTRGCRFCAVKTARLPRPLDPAEPENVARAIAEMQLDYVVITTVDRDDVADGGASHFAEAIRQVRRLTPDTLVEVLIGDFGGVPAHIARVVEAAPEVIAHNVETVERLTWPVRDRKSGYAKSLGVLAEVKRQAPRRPTKSSIMVGLGERPDEVTRTMHDLREVGVDFLTVGQYLQPNRKLLPVTEFVHPDRFAAWEEEGRAMGFAYVASGPLVRSSYRAGEFYIRQFLAGRPRPQPREAT